MLKKFFVNVFALAALALPCAAQVLQPQFIEVPNQEKAASQDCSLGVVYDSGVFNAGYSIGNGDPGDATMVMKFDLPAGTRKLDQVCACFLRTNSSAPGSIDFEAVVYNDDGPGGQPGTFLGFVNGSAIGIPVVGSSPRFFPVNFSNSSIVLPDPSVYIGVRWQGGTVVMCGDRSAVTPQRTDYGSGDSGATWSDLQNLFSSPPRALGVRVDPTPNPGACQPDDTTLCLNNGRFKVTATFDAGPQSGGQAEVVELTDETGYMWFFSANNVEVVIKVLNACTFNQRYWVYAAGLTDVRVVITVTDTQTGAVRTYINPQGRAFQPILDSSAFSTCP